MTRAFGSQPAEQMIAEKVVGSLSPLATNTGEIDRGDSLEQGVIRIPHAQTASY